MDQLKSIEPVFPLRGKVRDHNPALRVDPVEIRGGVVFLADRLQDSKLNHPEVSIRLQFLQ